MILLHTDKITKEERQKNYPLF